MELNQYIGAQIKKLREKNSMTQNMLANILNTTRQTISRYENGDRKASQDVLYTLAETFHITIDSFFPPRKNEINEKSDEPVEKKGTLIAAHIDDDVTEAEMEDIINYIEFIKNKHRNK